MITNKVTKTVFELLGDKVQGGYSLFVGDQEIPLFLNKDGTTKYPQIRVSPFIERGDTHYQKYIERKYQAYRHWQHGAFQVDIYSQDLALAQDAYDVITRRLVDFFNLETIIYNSNGLFDQIDDNVYRNGAFALMDDGLFKEIYGIRIKDTILKRVSDRNALIPDSYYVNNEFLYIKTDKNINDVEIKVLMQGRLFDNGLAYSDRGVHGYYLSKQRNLSSLEENEVERISFDLEILFSKKLNREELPELKKVKFNKANVR